MRNISRVIALFVLLGAAFAIFGIAQLTLNKNGHDQNTKHQSSQTRTGQSASQKKAKKRNRTYIVKSGDTLGSIAAKFRITLTRLLELNPDIDPQSLQTGEKITVPR